jgi:hypothetical protein
MHERQGEQAQQIPVKQLAKAPREIRAILGGENCEFRLRERV